MNYLQEYINYPDDAVINFNLGQEYEQMGQTVAAISFYFRTAERSDDNTLQYEALLRMALCFDRQRTRDDTQKVLLQKAMTLIMDRPEAHFLLARFHERQQQWHEGWTASIVALKVCRWDHAPLITHVEYPGKWGLLFENGVCAWWVGHTEESRRIMFDLRYSYALDDMHRTACDNNLRVCGWPKIALPYDAGMASRARCTFPGLETLQQNHSQSMQDLFVLTANQGKRDQWYLEVGSAEPFYNNNTALLERQFGWKGISLDINQDKVADFMRNRSNPVMCVDATRTEYASLLDNQHAPKRIGYLQVDCDPAENSYLILTRIPWDEYKFAAITFEHDYYADRTIRDRSRKYLLSLGYELMAGDISFDDSHSYEDWWVHPELVPVEVRDQLRDISSAVKPADQYLFPSVVEATTALPATVEAPMIRARPNNSMVNPSAAPGFWVVDDFYVNPNWVRDFALQQKYEVNRDGEKGYIGSRTEKQFLFDGLQEQFEYVLNRRITRWEGHGMNGRFQYCIAGEPLVFHCDPQAYAGMLYLTPDAPYQTGTRTHALKGTDIRHLKHPRIQECFLPGSRNFDGTRFETVDMLGNVYNRLVIFNAGYLHSATEYFGFNKENSRLWQMFFFD